MKLSDLGEFGFIERIGRSVQPGPGVRVGIGDDCAALELPPDRLLLTTTDLLIEDIHFRRQWTDPFLLGRKSVTVNISDIAAMGGEPHYLYLSFGLPPELPVEDLDLFVAGFLEAAAFYGAALVGGDTCRSPGPWFISVTAEGSIPAEEVVTRSGARPGDGIYVSGTLGDSALALKQLREEEIPHPFLAGRHRDPVARTGLARKLAEARIPSAMIDLSDGLLADLGHILAGSAVGACLEKEAIPLSAPFRKAAAAMPELFGLALQGGEDYELAFTVPMAKENALRAVVESVGCPVSRIGTILPPERGLALRDRKGHEYHPGTGGFDHFGS
jgi:thiamine-monophosphate kinase